MPAEERMHTGNVELYTIINAIALDIAFAVDDCRRLPCEAALLQL